MLAVNLTGAFLCTQAAAPLMRETGGGAIVNITSISGLRASTLRDRLRHQQSRPCASDQATGGRTRRARHPRQCRGARPGRHRDGEGRAHAGDPRRLSRPHAAQPLWARERTRQGHLLPVQRPRELHHRAGARSRRRLRRRPASACRRCAASGATADRIAGLVMSSARHQRPQPRVAQPQSAPHHRAHDDDDGVMRQHRRRRRADAWRWRRRGRRSAEWRRALRSAGWRRAASRRA